MYVVYYLVLLILVVYLVEKYLNIVHQRLITSIHPFYLSLIVQKSVFINIGRGDVTDEASILKAMRSVVMTILLIIIIYRAGWLSGAILDVFETEPLPPTSELWDLPGVSYTFVL